MVKNPPVLVTLNQEDKLANPLVRGHFLGGWLNLQILRPSARGLDNLPTFFGSLVDGVNVGK